MVAHHSALEVRIVTQIPQSPKLAPAGRGTARLRSHQRLKSCITSITSTIHVFITTAKPFSLRALHARKGKSATSCWPRNLDCAGARCRSSRTVRRSSRIRTRLHCSRRHGTAAGDMQSGQSPPELPLRISLCSHAIGYRGAKSVDVDCLAPCSLCPTLPTRTTPSSSLRFSSPGKSIVDRRGGMQSAILKEKRSRLFSPSQSPSRSRGSQFCHRQYHGASSRTLDSPILTRFVP